MSDVAAWVFLMIAFNGAAPERSPILVAVRFETEAECRAYEQARRLPPDYLLGCLPLGKPL